MVNNNKLSNESKGSYEMKLRKRRNLTKPNETKSNDRIKK